MSDVALQHACLRVATRAERRHRRVRAGRRRRWFGRSGLALGGMASLAVGALLGGALEGIHVLLGSPAPASAVPSGAANQARARDGATMEPAGFAARHDPGSRPPAGLSVPPQSGVPGASGGLPVAAPASAPSAPSSTGGSSAGSGGATSSAASAPNGTGGTLGSAGGTISQLPAVGPALSSATGSLGGAAGSATSSGSGSSGGSVTSVVSGVTSTLTNAASTALPTPGTP